MANSRLVYLLVLVAFCFAVQVEAKKGVLELEAINFPKIVDGSKNVFVQFTEFSWKESKDFEKVAKEFESERDVLIAKVDCSDAKDLKAKYGITSFPANRWFAKGGDVEHPEVYSGGETPEEINEYIQANLNPKIKELKSLASLIHENPSEIRKKIEALAGSENKEGLEKLYLTFASKIEKEGSEFVNKEKDRLQKLIDNKSTKKEKQTEFRKRLNILNAFAQKTVA